MKRSRKSSAARYTSLGDAPAGFSNGMLTSDTCQTTADLADFTRCTPKYDGTESGADPNFDFNDLSEPNPQGFARCSKGECNTADLDRFGYRKKNSDVPPVIPIVNLATPLFGMAFMVHMHKRLSGPRPELIEPARKTGMPVA